MGPQVVKRYAMVLVAWMPFFGIWVLYAMSYGKYRLPSAILTSLISMGSASLLGIAAWHVCQRLPWPLRLNLKFYLLQIVFASLYALLWSFIVYALESVWRGGNPFRGFWRFQLLPWQLLTGVWLYGLFAGVSYAVETRSRLHEKETLAVRAEGMAAAARLDALRARLNPHFLFNALHTLSALVKFNPKAAEAAIEDLGDMLRYTLKEDGRALVSFSEEYEFTRLYIAFEQFRYEERLKIAVHVEPAAFDFDIPPFSLQALVENAVRYAISVRSEGGSIWIDCFCQHGRLTTTVKDDGPGSNGDSNTSHHLGLCSLRERLVAAYGTKAELRITSGPQGFEARFTVPATEDG